MIRILLLYASFGDGHKQVVRALQEAAARSFESVELIEIDTFQETSPAASRFNETLYDVLTKYAPWVYGASYSWTRFLRYGHWLWRLLARFSRRAAWQALLEHKPDAVLQMFPDYALDKLPPGLSKEPFIGVVLTDFAVHSRWFHRRVDTYFLPDLKVVHEMTGYQGDATTEITGIPIRSQFYARMQSPVEKPFVLIATGGRGVFPDLLDVIQAIREGMPTLTVYVLCGRNQRMEQSVNTYAGNDDKVQALGFMSDVAGWFQHAEFAVVKAGGLTVAECVASQCPMIFYKPQPGQEEANARHVEGLTAGDVVRSVRSLEQVLGRLSQTELARRRTVLEGIKTQNAAVHVLMDVVQRVSQTYC